jgi:hypothetical protein
MLPPPRSLRVAGRAEHGDGGAPWGTPAVELKPGGRGEHAMLPPPRSLRMAGRAEHGDGGAPWGTPAVVIGA